MDFKDRYFHALIVRRDCWPYSSEVDLLRLIQVHRGALSAGSDDDTSQDHDISEMSTLERACQLGANI
jgi:hypothetical protein